MHGNQENIQKGGLAGCQKKDGKNRNCPTGNEPPFKSRYEASNSTSQARHRKSSSFTLTTNAERLIRCLADAVANPSVSGDAKDREDVFAMAHWLHEHLKRHTLEGEDLPLAPIIPGQIRNDMEKKTALIYGQFDVQSILEMNGRQKKSDGWDTGPFALTINEKTGRLGGRESSDDKGPILGWLNSDNYWLTTNTPALTYGLRGISFFRVTISGPESDLHSGGIGRMVYEPMTDLIQLLHTLVSPQGDILIKGVDVMVPRSDEDEKSAVQKI
ncbi:hypothetical protein BDN70DRAFT_917926 [Pholiota conissans]|uniref:Peptidase M20 dimerisation domain-containing protein n=1 Tax=Pholiota conissans TaxID=109636 RepID=A0A9P6CYG1_9AGAR|nr:hypothetical protein BDN70DRAFT_917926 [Pholiota conissans]